MPTAPLIWMANQAAPSLSGWMFCLKGTVTPRLYCAAGLIIPAMLATAGQLTPAMFSQGGEVEGA